MEKRKGAQPMLGEWAGDDFTNARREAFISSNPSGCTNFHHRVLHCATSNELCENAEVSQAKAIPAGRQ